MENQGIIARMRIIVIDDDEIIRCELQASPYAAAFHSDAYCI